MCERRVSKYNIREADKGGTAPVMFDRRRQNSFLRFIAKVIPASTQSLSVIEGKCVNVGKSIGFLCFKSSLRNTH